MYVMLTNQGSCMQPEQVLDEQSFIAKYWHPNTEVVTVTNPTTEDYIFSATVDAKIDIKTGRPQPEMRQYRVKKGGSERFPGSIANMYLSQMSSILAQKEGRLERMIDFTEKSKYYDQLTADSEDLIASYSPNPAYAEDNQHVVAPVETEVPFAGAKRGRPPKVATES